MSAAEPLTRRLLSEGLGTAFLLATVVGSGIMGNNLAGGNAALALLGNTLPTGAILVVLILILGSVSGAHMNPAVSLAFALRRELPWRDFAGYVAAQLVGAIIGVLTAHLMFALPVWQISTHVRQGSAQWFSEGIATFGLLLTVFGCVGARAVGRALRGRTLHHSGLLVHGVNVVCQSRGDGVARSFRYVFRNSASRSSRIHRRAIDRRVGGGRAFRLAVAGKSERAFDLSRGRRQWRPLPARPIPALQRRQYRRRRQG